MHPSTGSGRTDLISVSLKKIRKVVLSAISIAVQLQHLNLCQARLRENFKLLSYSAVTLLEHIW
jgi:hypothetical protein